MKIIRFGYTVRESHMEGNVRVIDKLGLHEVSVVREKP